LAAISSITNTGYSKFAIDSVDLAAIIIEPRHYIARQTFALRNHFLGYFAFRYFTVITTLRVHYYISFTVDLNCCFLNSIVVPTSDYL